MPIAIAGFAVKPAADQLPPRGAPAAPGTSPATAATLQSAKSAEAPSAVDDPDDEADSDGSAEDQAKGRFHKKPFISAWHLAPGGYPLFGGMDAAAARGGLGWVSKSGDRGLGRLREWATTPTMFFTRGEDAYRLGLTVLSLDAGTPSPEAEIGSLGQRIAKPTTRLRGGVAPEFAWSRKGAISPFLAIGSTPFNGVVGPTIAGRGGATFRLGETKVTPDIYRKSIAESILSYTGIVDPSTGRGFGRVVETGGEISIEHPISKQWNLDANGSAGAVRGVHVADNFHYSAAVSPAYDLGVPGFAWFTLGPAYEFDHFNRNLSEFTLGHGGYYSPRANHKVGVSLDFQSKEGEDFIVHANLFPGWEKSSQAASPVFPLGDDGARNRALRESGANITGEAAFAYRLGDRLSLGGLVRVQLSRQYDEVLAGLSLKVSFGAPAGLYEADLPSAAALVGAPER